MDLRRLGILSLIAGNLMKRMHRHKNHIIVLIGKLHHFMHPSLIILHPDKTTKNTYTIVYMYYIITYRE